MPELGAVAIIPARGGSKRLPRKNVLPFNGRPVIEYTIEAAIQSGCFDRVIVSSEDDEILDIASAANAEVDRRSNELGSDTATVAEVCADFLRRESSNGTDYRILAALYATAPMRHAEDIRSTMSLLDDGSCDYAIAATEYSHYVHQALAVDEQHFVMPRWPELYEARPADIGHLVAGNGSTYCVKVESFMNSGSFIGEKTRVHVMPMIRSIDIDTIDDFHMAESIHRLQNSLG